MYASVGSSLSLVVASSARQASRDDEILDGRMGGIVSSTVDTALAIVLSGNAGVGNRRSAVMQKSLVSSAFGKPVRHPNTSFPIPIRW